MSWLGLVLISLFAFSANGQAINVSNTTCASNADCNGGTCTGGICICPANLTGVFCELSNIPCNSTITCSGHGACNTTDIPQYPYLNLTIYTVNVTCQCDSGWTGNNCSTGGCEFSCQWFLEQAQAARCCYGEGNAWVTSCPGNDASQCAFNCADIKTAYQGQNCRAALDNHMGSQTFMNPDLCDIVSSR